MSKFLNYFTIFIVSLFLVGNLALPTNALADEEPTSTPEPTPQATEQPQSTPEPSPTSEPSATPTPTTEPTPQPSSSPSPEPSSTPTPQPTSTPAPTTSPEPSSTPTPGPSSTPAPTPPSATTTDPVSLNTPYSVSNMKVVFTSLPATPGSITFTTKTLTSSLVDQLKALTNTVYEITSSMSNGSFTYDLTLPLPAGVTGTNFKVFYAESLDGLNDPTQVSQSITNNGDGTFTIHNLNHFTVFVVVNPNSQANCDSITIGTTPGSTCFTTVQAAVNAAADGDTINVGNTGSPYNETVYVNKILTINGVGNPTVTAFVLQKTPVTITGITTSVTIETPTVSLTNPVNSSNQTNVTISGTGAANATVNYTITGTSGSVSGVGLVSATGVINITGINVSTLPDGALTLTVNLSSGSYSSANATAASFKDTTAPATASNLTLTNPINPSNQTSVSFSGTGEAGSTVNWTLSNEGSSLSGTTTVNGSGNFSVSGLNVSSFPDGTLTLNITLSDTAGNTSSTASTTATKDTVAPSVNAGSNQVRNASFTTTATATDPAPSSGIASYQWAQVSGPGTISFGTPNALSTTVSANQDGTYIIRLTVTDNAGNATSSQFSLVWDTQSPVISGLTNAVTNTTVTQTATVTDPSPSSGIASQTWSQVSGPGTITFGSPNSNSTTISADTDGSYVVRFTVVDNAGNSALANINFVWDTTNPTVSAGSNPTPKNATFTQVGSASDATSGLASTVWSQVSGPGTVTLGTPNSTTTTVSANADGTYVIRLTATDNAGNSASSTVTFVWDTVVPSVSAGPNVTTNTTFTQNGVVTDPAPSSGGLVYSWTQVSGPGTITFGTPNATSTTISADTDGTYVIRLTATDAAGNSNNSTFTLVWDTVAPTVNAGPNVTTNAGFTTTATASDPAPSSGIASYLWTQTSGPGTITFGTPNALNTTVSADTDGTYVLRLTVTDNAGNSTNSSFTLVWDTVTPTVNAGPDVTTNASFTQTATSTDPSPSSGGLVYQWTQMAGPGTVTFGSPNALVTTVSANQDGLYTLRLTVTDAAGNSNFDEFQLVWDTVAPTVSAGANVTTNTTFTQTGTVNDPAPSSGGLIYSWTQDSGPGVITFGSANAVSTTISANTDGTYVIRLTATDAAGNSNSSTFTLVWDTSAPVVNAGPNVSRNATFTTTATASDPAPSSGIASYQWVQVSGPGTITFGSANALNTTVTADTDGTYVVRLTVTDTAGNAASSQFTLTWDTVAPVVNAGADQLRNATFTQNGTVTDPAPSSGGLVYQWAQVSGPGTITFGTPNATSTTISASADGVYVISLTATDDAGNSTTDTFSLTWDTTAPTASITAPAANSTVSGNVTFSANATDTNGVVSVVFEYRRNDGVDTFHIIATDTTSPYSTIWDTNALAIDTYTIRITVTDTAGNVTQVSQNVDVATVILSSTVAATAVNSNSAVINWTTDDPTSSRVIYDTVSHPTLQAPPNYGYANSTATFDTAPKVINHSVILNGLKPGTTYYYRVVSAGSPEAVSEEFSFTTSQGAQASSSGGGTFVKPPSCDHSKPGSAPMLLSAKVVGGKIVLTWSKAKDPVTHYQIFYGLGHDSYQFGVHNTGNVTQFEIGGLQAGVTYYFRVKAVNGCTGSDASNELSARAGGPSLAGQFAQEVINVTSRAFGITEALAAEEESLEDEEATESADEESTASASPRPTVNPTSQTEIKTPSRSPMRDILVAAGLVILLTAGVLYYTTLRKKV